MAFISSEGKRSHLYHQGTQLLPIVEMGAVLIPLISSKKCPSEKNSDLPFKKASLLFL